MAVRQSAECFSVRHLSDRLGSYHGVANFALVRPLCDQRLKEMEHRAANSRRRTPGAHRQTRYAEDGRFARHRFGGYFNAPVGATLELLRLDHRPGDDGVWRGWVRRRLHQAGEATQPGFDRSSEAGTATCGRRGRMVGAIYFDAVLLDEIFME